MEMASRTIVFATTKWISAETFLLSQLQYLAASGWEVHLLTEPPSEGVPRRFRETEITFHMVKMSRNAAPLLDFIAFVSLVRKLRNIAPSVFVGSTPKASFLGIVAAWVARVPARVYWVWGLRLETERGLFRLLLSLVERIVVAFATHVRTVSPSLERELNRVVPKALLKQGPFKVSHANGVDLKRFRPANRSARMIARQRLGFPEDSLVVGFIGRLTPDKGVEVLIEAVELACRTVPNLVCAVAGELDEAKPLSKLHQELLSKPPWISLGYLQQPDEFYHAIDLLCTPSLREGLPTVNLEAAACGVPVITTSATGSIDSVIDGVGGLVVKPGSSIEIAKAIVLIARGGFSIEKHSASVAGWLETRFSNENVWGSNRLFFDSLIN